jgi:hypothetical protein
MLNNPVSHHALKHLFLASGGLLDWLLVMAGVALAMLSNAGGLDNIWR